MKHDEPQDSTPRQNDDLAYQGPRVEKPPRPEMTDEEKRRDQLLAAPNAIDSDADPRIEITEHDGVTRIDVAPDAAVRPGNPFETPAESGER